MTGTPVMAEESGKCGENLTWTLTDDGTLTIEGSGEMENCYASLWRNQQVQKVVISKGVTSIGKRAFMNCTGITEITIPEGVTGIGESAFMNCTGITEITIPESLTSIGEYAFSGCTGLTELTIPEGVTSIGEYAFSKCTGLTELTISASVTSIIGGSAFEGCTGLTKITVDPQNPSYRSEGNCLIESKTGKLIQGCKTSVIPADGSITSIGGGAFMNCTGLTELTIPEGVASIWQYAFMNCTGLTELTIPESVTNMEADAFRDCTGLTKITIPASVTHIDPDAFRGCTGLKTIYYTGTEEQWNAMYKWKTPAPVVFECGDPQNFCGKAVRWTLEDGVLTLSGSGSMANFFSEENQPWDTVRGEIRKIVISEGVTSVGDFAFQSCTALTEVSIPKSVTSIGKFAFGDCTSLTEVTIPKEVTSVGANAFYNCTQENMNIYCEAEEQPRTWDFQWIQNCNAVLHWGGLASTPDEGDGDIPSDSGDASGTDADKPSGSLLQNPFFWSTVCLAVGVIALAAVLAVLLLRKKKSAPAAPAQGPQNPPQT